MIFGEIPLRQSECLNKEHNGCCIPDDEHLKTYDLEYNLLNCKTKEQVENIMTTLGEWSGYKYRHVIPKLQSASRNGFDISEKEDLIIVRFNEFLVVLHAWYGATVYEIKL